MARRSIRVADVKEILVHWDAGEGISRIGRELGYSRPTVRKYVEAAVEVGLVRDGRRQGEVEWERLAEAALGRVTKPVVLGEAALDVARFRDYLEHRVGQVRLSVLHQRLRDDHGLRASWATFYRYVTSQWPERLQPEVRTTVRLDDPAPGEEAQVDFFYVRRWFDREAGRERRMYCFLMTLSHSRHAFIYPVIGEDAGSWLEGHVEAFRFFGGAPRRLVPDNLTSGILRADRYDPRLNRGYAELTRYYGSLVDPSRVRHPTDKPRVERNVDYARESFFRDRDYETLAQWREAAVHWSLEVAGQRVHGTTGERPLEAFSSREQARLIPLAPRPWELVTWTTAQVHADCHLQVAGARYSVPYRYVGRRLDVRVGAKMIEVYQGVELITTHVRQFKGRSTRQEDYPEAAQAFLRATPQACLERACQVGEMTLTIVGELLATGTLHHRREVQAILRLADRHSPERLERACKRALGAGDGRYRTVRGILEAALEDEEWESLAPPPTAGAFLRGPTALLGDGVAIALSGGD
jgi:transposase